MANFNRVILAGNLTRDPQLSYLPSQTPVVEFGLAINRRWRGQDGQQREDTCFIDCRAYRRQAEVINQYLSKGRGILIEGRLQFDTWEGQDGTRRSKHRVLVDRFEFIGGRPPGRGAPAPYPAEAQSPQPTPPEAPQEPEPAPPAPAAPEANSPPPSSYDEGPGEGEDIPF